MADEVFNAGNADLGSITSKVMNVKPDEAELTVDEDGITEYINKDMIIGDIITWYPDTALVLMKCGMHCISCGVSQFETLEQACAVHGLYVDDVAKVVNDYLTQTLGGKKETTEES